MPGVGGAPSDGLDDAPRGLAVDGVRGEGLQFELVIEATSDDVEHGLLRGAHRGLVVSGDPLRQSLRTVHQLVVSDDAGDQVGLQGTLSVDRFTAEFQVECHGDAARVDQPGDAPIPMMKIQRHQRRTEHRLIGSDPNVTGQRQFQAGAQRPAVDRRDHRLAHTHAAGEPTESDTLGVAAHHGRISLRPLRKPAVAVRAGAKRRTGTGHDRHINVVVSGEVDPDLA